MKTPMQELLQDIRDGGNAIYMIEKFYIEKEKQLLLNFNDRGFKIGRKNIAETANDYYEDTFGDNHEAGI